MKRFKSAVTSGTEVLGFTLFQFKNRYVNGSKMIAIRKKGDPEPKKPTSVPGNGMATPEMFPD
jgi:hypothetical protein